MVFLLVKIGYRSWLIFPLNLGSCLWTTLADFSSLNLIVISKGLSNKWFDGGWLWSGGCWKLWIVESISYSGYFNFKNIKNILSKLLRSWKKAFGVDDKCFARPNIVCKSDCFYLLSTQLCSWRRRPLFIFFLWWWSVLMISMPMNGKQYCC